MERATGSLEFVMSEAAAHAGVDRRRWYRQARGDDERSVLTVTTNSQSAVADHPRQISLTSRRSTIVLTRDFDCQ